MFGGRRASAVVIRMIAFEADGFPQDGDAICPGRELADHIARGLAKFATVALGPTCGDNGLDTLCKYEGLGIWVLLQDAPPGWALLVSRASELRALFEFGRRRRQNRERFEDFCGRMEQMLRSDPEVWSVRWEL